MERLTARDKSGYAYYPKCFEHPCEGERKCCTYTADFDCKFEQKVLNKLAYYEDLEEQGKLYIAGYIVCLDEHGLLSIKYGQHRRIVDEVYLTKVEAEARVREQRGLEDAK